MSDNLLQARQTFSITLHIETILHPPSHKAPDEKAEHYHRLLIQALLSNPEILSQVFRLAALATVPSAKGMLMAEYAKEGLSEQQLLASLIKQLEPSAQAYFTEEIEEQQHLVLFEGYEATIKQVQMTSLVEA